MGFFENIYRSSFCDDCLSRRREIRAGFFIFLLWKSITRLCCNGFVVFLFAIVRCLVKGFFMQKVVLSGYFGGSCFRFSFRRSETCRQYASGRRPSRANTLRQRGGYRTPELKRVLGWYSGNIRVLLLVTGNPILVPNLVSLRNLCWNLCSSHPFGSASE